MIQTNWNVWTKQDQKMFEFYSPFLPKNMPGPLCFDIGANVGGRSKIFLELGARVVAVEPQIECFDSLLVGQRRYHRLILLQKALGAENGQAEISVCDAHPMSSLSEDWMFAVKQTERFGKHKWIEKRTVDVTTLDSLIAVFGKPNFVKIDVEGYEYEVVQGLSTPVPALSFEFTPEFLKSTSACLDHLRKLSDITVNYSIAESMKFELAEWTDPQTLLKILEEYRGDHVLFGDVYVLSKTDG